MGREWLSFLLNVHAFNLPLVDKMPRPVEAEMDGYYDLTKEILNSAAPHHGALPPTYLIEASLVLLPLILIFQSQR